MDSSFLDQVSAAVPALAGVVVLVLALAAAVWAFQKSGKKGEEEKLFSGMVDKPEKEMFGPSSTWQDTSGMAPSEDPWQERKKRGINAVSSKKTNANGDKPFGSKYYYAHNNTKATGGYKDGLSMEDYTMNGPRLLSRGGVSVSERASEGESDSSALSDDGAKSQQSSTEQSQPKKIPQGKPTLSITKYLWDDPGDQKGVATIRIDSLPCQQKTSNTIPWKDVSVLEISAVLEGEGLVVTIKTESEFDYKLRFAKLYGEVEEVTVKTTKRLMVRLKKKRSRGNFNAWPRPHKKAVS